MSLSETVTKQLLSSLSKESSNPNDTLNNALRLLSKWRSVLIQNTLLEKEGTRVLQGPLKGLDFIEQSSEGCHIAKLLGCYEQPLQPYINAAIEKGYSTVLNIGCAEGYYAVGLARAMSDAKSLAFDTDPKALKALRLVYATKQCVFSTRVEELGYFDLGGDLRLTERNQRELDHKIALGLKSDFSSSYIRSQFFSCPNNEVQLIQAMLNGASEDELQTLSLELDTKIGVDTLPPVRTRLNKRLALLKRFDAL